MSLLDPSQESTFIRAIASEINSDAPRLIYADWLEEMGHEWKARFLRFQCWQEGFELSREEYRKLCYDLPKWYANTHPFLLHGRIRCMYKARTLNWISDHIRGDPGFVELVFRRGFIDSIKTVWQEYYDRAGSFFRIGMVRNVTLRDRDWMRRLPRVPLTNRELIAYGRDASGCWEGIPLLPDPPKKKRRGRLAGSVNGG